MYLDLYFVMLMDVVVKRIIGCIFKFVLGGYIEIEVMAVV